LGRPTIKLLHFRNSVAKEGVRCHARAISHPGRIGIVEPDVIWFRLRKIIETRGMSVWRLCAACRGPRLPGRRTLHATTATEGCVN